MWLDSYYRIVHFIRYKNGWVVVFLKMSYHLEMDTE